MYGPLLTVIQYLVHVPRLGVGWELDFGGFFPHFLFFSSVDHIFFYQRTSLIISHKICSINTHSLEEGQFLIMPLASSRSSIKRASRLSLPETISSTTRVSSSSRAVKRRASLRSRSRDASPATLNDKENEEPAKKAKMGTNSRSPGPTPYWMVRTQNASSYM